VWLEHPKSGHKKIERRNDNGQRDENGDVFERKKLGAAPHDKHAQAERDKAHDAEL
jgi:hypothetical protein